MAEAEHWGAIARAGAAALSRPLRPRRRPSPRELESRQAEVSPLLEPDEVVLVEEPPEEPEEAMPPRRPVAKARPELPEEVLGELEAGDPRRANQLAGRLQDAVEAYEADRFQEARRILERLAKAAPESAAVRELYGLCLYRMGRWREAIRELRSLARLAPITDQLPVLADCYRALGLHSKVDEIWTELRSASPGADVLSEGRLVYAGSLAERGRLQEAIELLASHAKPVMNPASRHLRTWYALADLYERAGNLIAARDLFAKVARFDPELGGAAERARMLGGSRPRKRKPAS